MLCTTVSCAARDGQHGYKYNKVYSLFHSTIRHLFGAKVRIIIGITCNYGGKNKHRCQESRWIPQTHRVGGLIIHHCLEVDNLYDACLVVHCKVCQVGIATDNVVGTDGISQRKQIEVFRVTDSCRSYFGFDGGEQAEGVNDGQQVIDIGLADILADFVAAGYIADFLNKPAADINVEALVVRIQRTSCV